MTRPASADNRNRRGSYLDPPPDIFAPAALTRPKSAMTLRVRGQLSHVKGMATLVQGRGRIAGVQVEDLTAGRLLLDRDSEVVIQAASENREATMRDIVDRRQRKYDQDRLVSDKKEDALAKMIVELDVLEAAQASADTANRHEVEAHQRMDEVRVETEAAEAMEREASE